jgi:hypothetical protein
MGDPRMKKHYLMLKIHNITGLKYLCKCSTTDESYCYKYNGSGKYWKRHLKRHGIDITTHILGVYDTNEALAEMGEHYSKILDVVESKEYANLIPETGQGGFSKEAHKAAQSEKVKSGRALKFKQLYTGVTKSDSSRVFKMAQTKAGRKKEDFEYIQHQAQQVSKGYYHTPWGTFISPEDAARKRGITAVSSIRKACTTNNNKIISKFAATVVKWFPLIEGKTYKEMGFGFTAK